MLETASLDTRSKPLAGVGQDRFTRLRRALIRRLKLTGSMTVIQREAVERAARLTLVVERAAADPSVSLDHFIRADNAAARARRRVDELANKARRSATTDWLRGSHGNAR
jgi:hypothetical protein